MRLRKSWQEIKQERVRRKDIGNFMTTGPFKVEMMLEERGDKLKKVCKVSEFM